MDLSIFNTASLYTASINLFEQLGIKLNSNTVKEIPLKDLLKSYFKNNETFNAVKTTYFIGIIDDSVFRATGMFDVNYSINDALQQGEKSYEGLMLFALELTKKPTRTEISEITRAFNRISHKMPVALVLKYTIDNEVVISIAISERFKYLQNWRQGEKTGKIIILRDIFTTHTHAGHQRILLDLVKPTGVTNYAQLHAQWLEVLDVNILNKKFFQDLANWYFDAINAVSFPDDVEKKKDVRNATNLIRLITRVIFIWFIKEKKLVPNLLFRQVYIDKILKDFNKDKKSQNYYNAILQNLFFGTLNQKMDERKFAKEGDINTNKEEYGVKNLFRYADLFNIAENEAMQLFKDVPFLNGGLFDCLDKPNEDGKIVYVDGFSRNPKKQASVPDYIFFGEEREVDLNEIFATKNKKYKTKGLINLLESYKFTVAENTPLEEEIALDPELLGKVFENLLASYNPETQTTARKQTGSFYTPREIVNYMVDESLLEYIKQNVNNENDNFETRLRELISYAETPNPFNENETKLLIEGINNCKILDPACGSGAYPMGILHKMVHLLQKLDPGNKLWKAQQKENIIGEQIRILERDRLAINDLSDKAVREKAENAVEGRLKEVDEIFESKNNFDDYARKLYLIENCIYGIDIQPIAVQISKLRFFISLIIDQNKQSIKENFGIRSLPNLETKFVAANTLIGLHKPQQTLLRNPQIEEKETELIELRHKYFSANTRKEKLQYQKQDKRLRQEIARMLESDGWQTAVAKQIVAFDPYDQNTFAPWFDPEWMFGLTKGFDIVIGNPPYGAKFNTAEKAIYRKAFPETQFKIDSYSLFVLKSLILLKENGINSYIINNTLLDNYFEEKVREKLLKNTSIKEINDLDDKVFETAVVHSMIFSFKKTKNPDNEIKINFSNNLLDGFKWIPQEYFLKQEKFTFSIREFENKDLLSSIRKKCVTLDKVLDLRQAIKTGNDEVYILSRASKKNHKPILRGKDVHKWSVTPPSLYVDYGDYLACPRDFKIFEQPKILIREAGSSIIASYDDDNYYIMSSLYNGIQIDKSYNLKFVLGLLNSSIFQFIMNKMTFEKTKGAFTKAKIYHFEKLPIKKTSSKIQIPYIHLVDYILALKENEKDSTFFERLLDAMVYEMYLPDEIIAGAAEVLKYLDNLPELKEGQPEQNLKTIEKVFKELSDPRHPVSAALLRLLTIDEINIIEGRK